GFKVVVDEIGPVDLIVERVGLYRQVLHDMGRPYRPGKIAVARALQIVRTADERQQAEALRLKVLQAIGGLARGRGSERYQNIGSHAEANPPREGSALLGTPRWML